MSALLKLEIPEGLDLPDFARNISSYRLEYRIQFIIIAIIIPLLITSNVIVGSTDCFFLSFHIAHFQKCLGCTLVHHYTLLSCFYFSRKHRLRTPLCKFYYCPFYECVQRIYNWKYVHTSPARITTHWMYTVCPVCDCVHHLPNHPLTSAHSKTTKNDCR